MLFDESDQANPDTRGGLVAVRPSADAGALDEAAQAGLSCCGRSLVSRFRELFDSLDDGVALSFCRRQGSGIAHPTRRIQKFNSIWSCAFQAGPKRQQKAAGGLRDAAMRGCERIQGGESGSVFRASQGKGAAG